MADLERLKRALQAAHAAGDTAAATKLAQAIRSAQATPATPSTPQYDSFGDLLKQRGQQFAQGATDAFASIPEAAAIAGAGNPNAGANVVSETVQKARADLAAAQKRREALIADYAELNRTPPQSDLDRIDVVIKEAQDIIGNNQGYLDTVTQGGTVNLKPDAQDRDLFKAGDALRQKSEDVFGKPQPNDQSFWAQVAQGGGTVAGMIAQGPFALAGGSAMNSSQLYKEAIDAGATEEDAKRAAELGAWVGTTEIVPITRALKLLPPRLRKEVGSKFWKKVSDIAQSSGEEAAQEYAQTVANNLIAQNIYDPERGWNEGAAESALVGAVIGGGVGAIGVTVNNSLYTDEGSLKKPEDLDNTQQQAAGDLARTFKAITDANPDWNLKDVDKTSATGARAVVDTAHVQLTEALKQRFADMKSRVKTNQADTFESVSEKILAQAAYREGRNKTKNLVGNQELDALRSLAGDTREGQEAVNLILQLNQLTELHNSGYQGGLSQFTDQFSVFGSKVGYDKGAVATERLLRPLLSGGAALQTGGLSIPAQMAVSGGGRAIDKLTGNYSQIDKFVRRNAETPGLQQPTAPSLRDAAAAQLQADEDAKLREEALRTTREAEQRELNLQLAQQNAPATPGSPQFTMEDATGLSRDGVSRILRVLKGRNDNPALIRAIQEYEQSVATGGRIEDLSPLIRAVRQFQQDNPEYVPMVRPPNSLSNPMLADPAAPGQPPAVSTTEANPVQAQTFGPQFTTQENYNRGIEANKAMNAELVEGVTTDPELNRVQKGRLITSLDVLANNLGSDPVAAAQEQVQKLEEAGVPQEAIDAYVKPYVDRVVGQQSRPRMAMAPQEDAPATATKAAAPFIRGETTNIQMPNELGTTFDFAKNSNFAKGRDFKVALQEKALAAQKEEGINLSELSDENINRLADYVVADALVALQDNSNAIGWYDRTVSDALASLAKIYPEIQTNPANRLQFIWALAVTSNGTKVDKNFELAADAYDHLQRTGRFPTDIGIGEAARAINGGLQQYHTMLDKFDGDHVRLEEFMNSQVPVKQIEQEYGVQISGEGKNTLVRGASILGPKIGNGFFSNLYGNFDALTMDRWLMRTVGRHRGTLININMPMVKKKTGEIKTLLKDASPETMKALRQIFKPTGVKIGKNLSTEDIYRLAVRIAKESTSKPWREGLNGVSADLRKAGNALAKYLDGQVEAPAGAKERDFIRAVFTQALGRLNTEPSVTRRSNQGLTMSDLQALLWYPEKRLYDTAKAKEGEESRGYADDEAPDYANAARKLAERRQANAIGSGLGSPGPDGPRGGGTSSPNARPALAPVQDNVAGVLAQRIAGGSPRRSPVPSTQEVKQAAEPVRQALSVGLPGGEFENGIKDINQVRKLADAIGVVLKMTDDQDLINKVAGYEQGTSGPLGVYNPAAQEAYALNPRQDPSLLVQDISEFQSYIIALHEVAHGVSDMSGDNFYGLFGDYKRPDGKAIANPMTEIPDVVRQGSFDDQVSRMLIMYKDGLHQSTGRAAQAERKKIVTEMRKLQDKGKYDNGSDVRYVGGAKTRDAARRDTPYYKYIRRGPEFAVDPLIFYMHNPKRMKKEFPATAKMIRDFFKNSSKINFYSHPLAMAVAVVLASMLKAEQEEEQKKQMPPGALNQPMMPGALSA